MVNKKKRELQLAAGIFTIVIGSVGVVMFVTFALLLFGPTIQELWPVEMIGTFLVVFLVYFMINSLAIIGGADMCRHEVSRRMRIYNLVFTFLMGNLISFVLCIIILHMKDEAEEVAVSAEPSVSKESSLEEVGQTLIKYKKLLDEKIITKADFEAKKKELLNI
jgi:hypothetical protein